MIFPKSETFKNLPKSTGKTLAQVPQTTLPNKTQTPTKTTTRTRKSSVFAPRQGVDPEKVNQLIAKLKDGDISQKVMTELRKTAESLSRGVSKGNDWSPKLLELLAACPPDQWELQSAVVAEVLKRTTIHCSLVAKTINAIPPDAKAAVIDGALREMKRDRLDLLLTCLGSLPDAEIDLAKRELQIARNRMDFVNECNDIRKLSLKDGLKPLLDLVGRVGPGVCGAELKASRECLAEYVKLSLVKKGMTRSIVTLFLQCQNSSLQSTIVTMACECASRGVVFNPVFFDGFVEAVPDAVINDLSDPGKTWILRVKESARRDACDTLHPLNLFGRLLANKRESLTAAQMDDARSLAETFGSLYVRPSDGSGMSFFESSTIDALADSLFGYLNKWFRDGVKDDEEFVKSSGRLILMLPFRIGIPVLRTLFKIVNEEGLRTAPENWAFLCDDLYLEDAVQFLCDEDKRGDAHALVNACPKSWPGVRRIAVKFMCDEDLFDLAQPLLTGIPKEMEKHVAAGLLETKGTGAYPAELVQLIACLPAESQFAAVGILVASKEWSEFDAIEERVRATGGLRPVLPAFDEVRSNNDLTGAQVELNHGTTCALRLRETQFPMHVVAGMLEPESWIEPDPYYRGGSARAFVTTLWSSLRGATLIDSAVIDSAVKFIIEKAGPAEGKATAMRLQGRVSQIREAVLAMKGEITTKQGMDLEKKLIRQLNDIGTWLAAC